MWQTLIRALYYAVRKYTTIKLLSIMSEAQWREILE